MEGNSPLDRPPRTDEIEQFKQSEELEGTLGYGSELMKSVLDNDKENIDDGTILKDALNQGLSGFTPDIMFEKFVKNYRLAKKLYGATLLRRITGYDPEYVEKNINVPEFQKEMRSKLDKKFKELRKKGLLDKNNEIAEEGIELAALVMYTEDFDNVVPLGFRGERFQKSRHVYGERTDLKDFRTGDRFKDIALQSSVKRAIRRGHRRLVKEDLTVHVRQRKGEIELIYAVDASASMKGEKLDAAKRAGISLSYRALDAKDRVGLLVFGESVQVKVYPSHEFGIILKEMTRIRPGGQTNIAGVIEESFSTFSEKKVSKHLLLLSDALPTAGDEPQHEALQAVSHAAARGITVSLIGLSLNKEGERFARRFVEIGGGRFYLVRALEDLNYLVLEDYYAV